MSWQTFIALNWPALDNGDPNSGTQIGQQDAATVWESWKESYQIFLPNGQKPASWSASANVPKACEGLGEGRLLQQMGKVPDVLDEFIQPFQSGPLVDQAGVYTRNEIVVNQPMFNDIVNNGLYSVEGQQAFFKASSSNTVAFSCGDPKTSEVGSLMVKASWKVLDGNDKRENFHTVDALVYTPGNSDPSKGPVVPESCKAEPVGLVGLHIVHKTSSAPQWVWSTFEHVDNVPEKPRPRPNAKARTCSTTPAARPKSISHRPGHGTRR